MSATDELSASMRTVFGSEVAWAMGQVEPERDWDKSSPGKFVWSVPDFIDTGLGCQVG
jgi:hypothetical protein